MGEYYMRDDLASRLKAMLTPSKDQPLVALAFGVNVSTNTQFQAGNQEVVTTAISDYLDHQSGPLSGVGAGLAVGKILNFLGGTRTVRTDPG